MVQPNTISNRGAKIIMKRGIMTIGSEQRVADVDAIVAKKKLELCLFYKTKN
jgi:hypothetical protein